MRLFVCEYVTGGGFAGSAMAPLGLQREGGLMLGSLVRDLAEDGALDLVVSRDARMPMPDLPDTRVVRVAAGDDCWRVWADAITAADAVWPIAPETSGVLYRLTALVAASGKVLLGSRPDAVRLCGSKLETVAKLAERGIVVVPTARLTADLAVDPPGAGPWVVKPDDGAGAEDTVLVESAGALAAFVAGASDGPDWVMQPFVPGEAASLSLLCRDGEVSLLACNSQRVAVEAGRFRYQGWTVGGMEARRGRYEALATSVARAIPGLWGYVGVDLVDTASGPVILEINPRLTTTYAGLRRAIDRNPASLVLALASGAPLPPICDVRPQEL